MTPPLLRTLAPSQLKSARRGPIDTETARRAGEIVASVRTRGLTAVREHARYFRERTDDQPLVLTKAEFAGAPESIPAADRALLERCADRVRAFANAQRAALQPLAVPVPGGEAGHTIVPVQSAGCYAPGGRFPLPSSVLMTAVTARVAGCERVVVATPNPAPIMLAAAAVAHADEVLCIGGAQAIATLAYGIDGFAPVDFICGPGNRFVTAAKHIVHGIVGIDMLAGPSELLVLADDSADPNLIAADLLAQAEHDTDAVPVLITTDASLVERVNGAIAEQLARLATAETAQAALRNGFACVAPTMDDAVKAVDSLAPEHLEVMTRDAPAVAARIRHAGAVFIGPAAAEVLGDFATGPNHTLPTGGAARFGAGLSVLHFLRARTYIRIDEPDRSRPLLDDAAHMARLEGLAGHEHAAHRRLSATNG